MFAGLRVTLYEVFGYLLPGAVSLCGLGIVAWSCFWPAATLAPPNASAPFWVTIGLIAYLLGHLTQALGNLVSCGWKPEVELLSEGSRVTALVDAAKKRLLTSA